MYCKRIYCNSNFGFDFKLSLCLIKSLLSKADFLQFYPFTVLSSIFLVEFYSNNKSNLANLASDNEALYVCLTARLIKYSCRL